MPDRQADILGRPRSLLSRPQLVVHQTPTPDDEKAERLLREFCEHLSPDTHLQVLRWKGWGDKSSAEIEWAEPNSLPALKASGQLFFGLDQIAKLLQLERDELESLRAYRAR